MKVTLVGFTQDGTRRTFTMKGDRCVVGRETGVGLRIPVPTVSRQHCELFIEDDDLILRDLGSSNGTFLNGKRVQEVVVEAGDRLRIGPGHFVIQIDDEPADITPDMLEGDPQGSSMMAEPPRRATASKAEPEGLSSDGVEEVSSIGAPQGGPVDPNDESDGTGGAFDDPLDAMIERSGKADDSDFDFDFFDDDEDEDEDDDLR